MQRYVVVATLVKVYQYHTFAYSRWSYFRQFYNTGKQNFKNVIGIYHVSVLVCSSLEK